MATGFSALSLDFSAPFQVTFNRDLIRERCTFFILTNELHFHCLMLSHLQHSFAHMHDFSPPPPSPLTRFIIPSCCCSSHDIAFHSYQSENRTLIQWSFYICKLIGCWWLWGRFKGLASMAMCLKARSINWDHRAFCFLVILFTRLITQKAERFLFCTEKASLSMKVYNSALNTA